MESTRDRATPTPREAPATGAPEELYERARRAVAGGDLPGARESLGGLGRTLETHFALEDKVYFPAVAALRPDLEPELRRLGAEHERMLARVAEMVARLTTAEAGALLEALDELIATFERHEGREEALLGSLTGSQEN